MVKKILKIFGCIFAVMLFLLGAVIYMYPFINEYTVNKNAGEALETFRSQRNIVHEQKQNNNNSSSEEKIDNTNKFSQLYEDMKKYNSDIYKNGQKDLKDAWSYEQSAFDLSQYGIYNGVVAELRIPKMNLDLPVYLGATWNNMGIGAAQLGQTSMPIGGNNTNCVIAGHRGSSGGKFFLDIELLEKGDKIYIDNLWETLTYRVSDIEIIDPYDTDKIHIQKNKDMVTLVTCHPYPYNYQRYVVYCERYCESDSDKPKENSYDVSDENSSSDISKTESSSQQKTQINDGGSQFFIVFEKSLYIIVPTALIVLAFFLFRRKKS